MGMKAMDRLALHGGQPVRTKPWVSKYMGSEELGEVEKARVLDVLAKKRVFRYLPTGLETSECSALESEYRSFLGTEYALAVNSGTSALICALVACGVGPGDEVIIPAYTWVATAAAVTMVGAIPILCEIDESLTLDPKDMVKRITPRTRAIIAVHMRGISADMDAIMNVAREHGIRVIEDAAQANGGTYKGRMLGSIGDVGCFSLQQSKVITTGEGGMLVTNSEELWQRAVLYHDGAGYQFRFIERKIPAFPGQNYRLTELQAALSLGQLEKMPEILRKTHKNKETIVRGLKGQSKIGLAPVFGTEHDLGLSLVFYVADGTKAQEVVNALNAEGIQAFRVYDGEAKDQHIYINWEFLLAKRDPWGGNYPWSIADSEVEYSKDTCPATLDLLCRAVQVHLNHLVTDEDIDDLLVAVDKVATHLL